MKDQLLKETQSDLTKLGLYQIFGGAIGILFCLWALFQSAILTGAALLIHLIALLLFSYSIFCGLLCLNSKRNALPHSLTNQILQVFSFAIMGYAFKYAAGFFLTSGFDLTDSFNFHFGAGLSNFSININKEKEKLEVDFNLVALVFIYWIDKQMKKIKEEAGIRRASSIGNT